MSNFIATEVAVNILSTIGFIRSNTFSLLLKKNCNIYKFRFTVEVV
jgi:hypothetical protein